MFLPRTYWFFIVVGSVGILSGEHVAAGEPIRFSSPTLTNSVPKSANTGRVTRKPGTLDRSSGNTTVDAPLPAQDSMDSLSAERLREAIQRQKYWIFLKPEDLQKSSGSRSAKESGKDKVDANGNPVRAKSVLERYFEDSEKKKNSESDSSDSGDEESISEDKSGLEVVDRSDVEMRRGVNWDNLFKDTESNTGIAQQTDFIGNMFKRQSFIGTPGSATAAFAAESVRAKQAQQERSDSFDRMLGRGAAKSLLPGEGDLLNGAVDTTRQPLNPITAGLPDLSAAPGKAVDGLNPFGSSPLNSPLRNVRLPGTDDLSSKIGGGAIFNPPSANSFMAAPPKPINFEFPKRKF
jgi:hypothetical protein